MRNKFLNIPLAVILAAGLIYTPAAYAGGAVKAVTTFVNQVVNTVIAVVEVAIIATVATVTFGTACTYTNFCKNLEADAICRAGSGQGPTDLNCNSGAGAQIIGGSLNSDIPAGTEFWIQTNATPSCESVTLNVNSKGYNYAILRNNVMVAQLPASQGSFTDSKLTPHTNYVYNVRIPYPEIAEKTTSDSSPYNVYTKCLPQCGFGIGNKEVAKFGATQLIWKCKYNDSVTDYGKCSVNNITAGKINSVLSTGGSLDVFPAEPTDYVLNCSNVDGSISLPASVNVLEPGIREVKP